MDFTSSCSREAMAAAGSMSPRSSMSRAIFTWVSTSWVRTPLRRPHQDVAGLQVVRHERPVLRDPRDDLLLRGPSDLRDRLRVETESLHRPDLGLETLQGLLVLAEPFVELDGDGLRSLRGLDRLGVLMCVEELLRDCERCLSRFDVGHREPQDGDESFRVPDRFLRVARLCRLQEADSRSLVVEHVITRPGNCVAFSHQEKPARNRWDVEYMEGTGDKGSDGPSDSVLSFSIP